MTLEERRERRRLRREKQREDNIKRAAKMHAARMKSETIIANPLPQFKQSVFVGCSGWRYWKWRDSFYAGVPQNDWFGRYIKSFDTVKINASFYSWPTVAGPSGLEASAREEKVHLHGQGERAHYSHQEVQGHKDISEGFWHDRRRPRRPHGVFSVPASVELPLHQDPPQRHCQPARSRTPQCRRIPGTPAGGTTTCTAPFERPGYLLLLQRPETAR